MEQVESIKAERDAIESEIKSATTDMSKQHLHFSSMRISYPIAKRHISVKVTRLTSPLAKCVVDIRLGTIVQRSFL